MRRAFDMYSNDTDGQTFNYLNVFARIEGCEKWVDVRRNLGKNKDEQYNPDAPARAAAFFAMSFFSLSTLPRILVC
jgi:hypothetical protein